MSSIKNLVDAFLQSKGLKKISGSDNDASPLLPLIMMDSAYQIFSKYIRKVDFKHELKRYRGEWIKNYNAFNKEYFSCYNDELTDAMVDLMDDFEKYIEHDLFITFVQFENLFISEPLERQEMMAACLLANVMCQSAELVYERVYVGRKNKNLLACYSWMHKINEKYYGKDKPMVNPNESDMITKCVDILCRKEVEFLRNYL